jgi:uncharacterized SAM-binding protein YcdF (DUF218 family)
MSGSSSLIGRGGAGRRRWQLAAIAALLPVLAWAVGLVWFSNAVERPSSLPPWADGIVALTGGATRIETALHLLAEGRGDRLLISGMGSGIDLPALAQRAGLDPRPLEERVTLGRNAISTRGNAIETAEWAERNQVHSLIVVTAYYHMPRALAELGRAMPRVKLLAWPVLLSHGEGTPQPTLRLLIEEYNKYLLVVSGLSSWLLPREAGREIAPPGRRV